VQFPPGAQTFWQTPVWQNPVQQSPPPLGQDPPAAVQPMVVDVVLVLVLVDEVVVGVLTQFVRRLVNVLAKGQLAVQAWPAGQHLVLAPVPHGV
jgi:hypothetical protein